MSQDSLSEAPSRIEVTVVEAEACHFCADAHEALSGFAARYPIALTTIDARGSRGMELMQEHRAAMSPLVLVDGEFFSQGRLPRGKFQQLLEKRTAAAMAR